jgi:hypothetical protein
MATSTNAPMRHTDYIISKRILEITYKEDISLGGWFPCGDKKSFRKKCAQYTV